MSLIIYKSNFLDHSAKLASFIKSWIASCGRCTPCRHCTVILTRINLHGDCSGIIWKANKTLTLNIYFRKRRKLQHAPTFFHWYTPLQKKKVQKLGSSVAHNLRSSIVFQLKVKNTTLIKSHRPTNKIEINITYAWRLDVIFDVYDQHIDDSVQDDTVKQLQCLTKTGHFTFFNISHLCWWQPPSPPVCCLSNSGGQAYQTLDARRPCVSHGSCTCVEQSSTSRQGCVITFVVPELPEDMAFWTDVGTLTLPGST